MAAIRDSSSRIPAPALLLAALVVMLSASAPAMGGQEIIGSGIARSEARDPTGFHRIALSIHAKLDLRQDGSEGLTITGDDNIIALVETIVEDGTLTIRWKKGAYSTRYKDLGIVAHAKSIDGLAIAGSGEIAAKSLKAGKLRVSLAGSGRAAIDALNADALNVNIEGSGDLALAGRIVSLDVSVAGSGRVSAAKLESQMATVTVAGSGRALLWATQALDANVLGSGSVRYYGQPRVHSAIAGSGMVKQVSDRPG